MKKKTSKTGRNSAKILGVRLDVTSMSQVLSEVAAKSASGLKFYVVTPNPEIILKAQGDKELLKALNSADISIPDGVGLKFAEPRLPIIHGRKVVLELCQLAVKKGWKVFLLGGMPGVAEEAARKLTISHQSLAISHASGPRLDNEAAPLSEVDTRIQSDILDKINIIRPDILFVGFGAPKQEKWIYKNLNKIKAKCIMTVGGALDYIAGTATLPPAWMEKLELEWLWRLVNEPWRFGRVLNATIIFPLYVLMRGKNHGG